MTPMSFDAFDAWVQTQSPLLQEAAFFDEAEHFEDDGVQFHRGDLSVDAIAVAPVTVIDGNLTCREIDDAFEVGLLVVTGDLHIDYIGRLSINVVVGGNLHAQSLCLNTLNDYGLTVGGNVVADYFAEFGCNVEVKGKIVCPTVLNGGNTISAGGGIEGELVARPSLEQAAEVVLAQLHHPDGCVDEGKFLAHVRAGRNPYRQAPVA